MFDDNAKMHAMKAIMDYADGAEDDGMRSAAAPRRESSGGLSDPNFMKDSGTKGAEGEKAAAMGAANNDKLDSANGPVDHDNAMKDAGAGDEDEDDDMKKKMGMGSLMSMFD